jgi:small-conductance mechanosensitive channel
VILPNTTLIEVPIKTYTAESTVRMQVKIGIHYDASFDKAHDAIVQALNQVSFIVNKEKTRVYFSSFGASSMDLLIHYYISPAQCFQV